MLRFATPSIALTGTSVLLVVLAAVLEVLALRYGFPVGVRSAAGLLQYLSLHAAASILLPLALLPFIPKYLMRRPAALLGLAAVCIFAVPVLGFVTVLAAFPVLIRYQDRRPPTEFDSVVLPELDQDQYRRHHFRFAGSREFLRRGTVPESLRMRVMAVLQHVSGRTAAPLLHDVLDDPSEDMRLLGVGILDNLTKRINDAITQEYVVLNQAREGGAQELQSVRRLSDLHWELVYEGLAQGDLRTHAIRQSLDFCRRALKLAPDHAALRLREGRLLHEQGDADAALRAYARARELGVPATRVVPYQAQLHFERRDFAAVRGLMRSLDQWDALPGLQDVIRYWSRP